MFDKIRLFLASKWLEFETQAILADLYRQALSEKRTAWEINGRLEAEYLDLKRRHAGLVATVQSMAKFEAEALELREEIRRLTGRGLPD